MFNKIKRTTQHTLIFALGKISSKLVGFVLLPIYTKQITVSDYGVLGLLEMIELLGVNVLTLGLPQAILRWYSLTDLSETKKRIVFTGFGFTLFVCILFIMGALPARDQLSAIIFGDQKYGRFLIYVLAIISFHVLAGIPQTILRAEEKSILYSASIIAQFSLSLLLNIYFVAFKGLGVEGILLANTISSGFTLLILLPYLLKRMVIKIDYPLLREMMVFGYPFIFTAVVSTILNLGDRYLLTKMATLTEVGLYSLGYKFSNVIKIFIIDSFILSMPIVGWQLVKDNDDPKRFFSKTFTYLIFGLLWVGLVISVFAKNIIHVFALNSDYWDAYRVIPYLVTGVILLGISHFLYFILQIPQKTKNISVIISISAVINIAINILIIPYYGMMGAAWAAIISNAAGVIFALSQVKKHYFLAYEKKRIFLLVIGSVIIFLCTLLMKEWNSVLVIPGNALLILSYPLLLWLIKFYDKPEIDRIKKLLHLSHG